MDGSFEDFYKANTGLVKKVSIKAYARFAAMGANLEYVDIEQEASIAMMNAWRHFDPDRGFKFSTYFYRAANNAFNRIADGFSQEAEAIGVFSIDAATDSDGESANWESMVDGGHATPEQIMSGKQLVGEIRESVSPLAFAIIELMANPPAEMQREWVQRCNTLGLVRAEMTMQFIAAYLSALSGIPLPEVSKAAIEVANLKKVFHV